MVNVNNIYYGRLLVLTEYLVRFSLKLINQMSVHSLYKNRFIVTIRDNYYFLINIFLKGIDTYN